jgi:DNA primase
MARISKTSIEAVVAAADMLDIVAQHTQLKKSGANYMGRCPFHEERTPSFSVDPVEKLYYCFGCGEGGDLLGFVQKKENLDFAQAVESLADRYGVTLEYEEAGGAGDADRKRRERLRKLLEQACAYYERVLREARAAEAARAYLAGRGLRDEVCRTFRLGFSPSAWRTLSEAAKTKGFTDKELLDAGLTVAGQKGNAYDRFRGRLMFPLTDERGRVLGFGARTLGDEKPKYINSPETPLYHKSEALFGLDRARSAAAREDRLFVVEGYTDVLALVQAGVENVVASMGTAFTEAQLRRLTKVTRNLLLCFDADAAGVGAMQRALELARRLGITMRIVRVPEGLDPADYVLGGAEAEAFLQLAEQAETLLQFRVRSVLSAHDVSSFDGRIRAFAELRNVLAQAESPLERNEAEILISNSLRLKEEQTRALLAGDLPASGKPTSEAVRLDAVAARRADRYAKGSGRERVVMGRHELEVRFLAGCLAVPATGREYLAAIDEGFFAGQETRRAYGLVVQRLGASGAGKTQSEPDSDEGEGEAGRAVMAEVVLRAAGEPFGARVLEELFLRVQEAHVAGLVARLKVAVGHDEAGQDENRLLELEATRRRIREALRALPVDD